MFVIHVTRAAIGPKQLLFVYNTIHCSNVLCIQRNICTFFRPRCQRAHLILCKFQYLILSLIFKLNCVWSNQDWAKLFAKVVGQKLHAVKTTLYRVINKKNCRKCLELTCFSRTAKLS